MQDAINAVTEKFDCLWRSDECFWVIFDDVFRESVNMNIRDLHRDLLVSRVRVCHISSLSHFFIVMLPDSSNIRTSLAALDNVGRGNV